MKRVLGASVAVYVWLLSYPLTRAVELVVDRARRTHLELVDGPAAAASIERAMAAIAIETASR